MGRIHKSLTHPNRKLFFKYIFVRFTEAIATTTSTTTTEDSGGGVPGDAAAAASKNKSKDKGLKDWQIGMSPIGIFTYMCL